MIEVSIDKFQLKKYVELKPIYLSIIPAIEIDDEDMWYIYSKRNICYFKYNEKPNCK